MQRNSLTIPRPAFWLGYAGLIPFLGATAINLIPSAPLHGIALQALLAYGAVILSFLGGIRWGIAIATTKPIDLFVPLFISILPALMGWCSLLLPPPIGLVLLAMGFTGMWLVDLRIPSAPHWYRWLRLPLSIGAVAALLLGLLS